MSLLHGSHTFATHKPLGTRGVVHGSRSILPSHAPTSCGVPLLVGAAVLVWSAGFFLVSLALAHVWDLGCRQPPSAMLAIPRGAQRITTMILPRDTIRKPLDDRYRTPRPLADRVSTRQRRNGRGVACRARHIRPQRSAEDPDAASGAGSAVRLAVPARGARGQPAASHQHRRAVRLRPAPRPPVLSSDGVRGRPERVRAPTQATLVCV